MSRTKTAGDRGETAVAAYLEGRGCTILARQWRCRQGELDLVARSPEGVLCFVEVKLRGHRPAPGGRGRTQAGPAAGRGRPVSEYLRHRRPRPF